MTVSVTTTESHTTKAVKKYGKFAGRWINGVLETAQGSVRDVVRRPL
jgi:hypothetical protein